MKKDIISTSIKLCIAILTPIIFFIGFMIADSLEYDQVRKKEIIQNYIDDKNLFTELATYGQEENSKKFSINKDKEKGFRTSLKIDDSVKGNIDNEKVKEDILNLFSKLKFKYIVKDDNKIYFVRQTDLRFDQGIIFLKDGKILEGDKFSKLEPIEGNWYYYESKD